MFFRHVVLYIGRGPQTPHLTLCRAAPSVVRPNRDLAQNAAQSAMVARRRHGLELFVLQLCSCAVLRHSAAPGEHPARRAPARATVMPAQPRPAGGLCTVRERKGLQAASANTATLDPAGTPCGLRLRGGGKTDSGSGGPDEAKRRRRKRKKAKKDIFVAVQERPKVRFGRACARACVRGALHCEDHVRAHGLLALRHM